MTGQDHSTVDLLGRRLDLVANLSALTAAMHKLIQEAAGTEMEILRLQLALGREPANTEFAHELREAEDRAEAIQSAQAEALEEIAAVEATVAQIDHEIAAAKGGRS